MKDLKAILLDLGGVVFQSTGISNDQVHWDIISRLNEKYAHDLNLGKDVFPVFLRQYNQLTNQKLDGQAFLQSVFDTLTMNEELINMFYPRYDILIVSDNYRENIDYISRRYDFERWASKQIYSFDYGMVKKNPAFFERLLGELDYTVDEMLFIDDSQGKLDSAALHGIEGILFRDNAQLKTTLKEYL